jgi:hypothetical protein
MMDNGNDPPLVDIVICGSTLWEVEHILQLMHYEVCCLVFESTTPFFKLRFNCSPIKIQHVIFNCTSNVFFLPFQEV